MKIEHLTATDYVAKEGLVFIDTRELHPLYDKLAFHANLILSGSKGIGKSLSVAAYCALKKYPVITFDCSEDVRRSHLVGMFVPRGKETPFVLGPLTTAFEVANESGHCVVILEEINALSPQSQKLLNGVTDFRKSLEVPEAQRVFKLNAGAKLWIVGTMNNAGYAGTFALNEDLKSRFRMIPLEYPSKGDEKKIISELLAKDSVPFEMPMLEKLLTLAQESRQTAFEYALSTRDLVQIMEDIYRVGAQKAFWIASGKFEEGDRVNLLKRIESIFGIGVRVLAKNTG